MKRIIPTLVFSLTLCCCAYIAVSPALVFNFYAEDSMAQELFWKGRHTYHVTVDDPIIPSQIAGPLDAWGGNEKKDIIISSPYAGRVVVSMEILDSHESSPPVIGLYANGVKVSEYKVPKGHGKPSDGWRDGKISQMKIEITPGLLDSRSPEITLRSESGSWAAIGGLEIHKLPPMWVFWAGAAGLSFLIIYGAWRITAKRMWKTAIANTALLLASTAAGLVAMEAGLRAFKPQPDFAMNVASPYKVDEDTEHLLLENFVSPMGFDTNRFGMRDYDHYTRAKPAGVYRIIALGDSFTQGTTKLEDTWPKALERMFEGSVPKVEVLNAGVNGYGQDNEYYYLKKYGLGFQPDMALVGEFNGNDIFDNCEHNSRTVVDGALIEKTKLAQYTPEEISREKRRLLFLNKFHLYRLVKYRNYGGIAKHFQKNSAKVRKELSQMTDDCMLSETMGLYRAPENWGPNSEIPMYWDKTVGYIEKMRAVSESSGVTLAVALLPGVSQFKSAETAATHATVEGFDARYPQKLFMDEAAKRGWRMLDVFPFMDSKWDRKQSIHYCGDVHYNELGNRLAAEAIFQWIMKEHMISFTKSPKNGAGQFGG